MLCVVDLLSPAEGGLIAPGAEALVDAGEAESSLPVRVSLCWPPCLSNKVFQDVSPVREASPVRELEPAGLPAAGTVTGECDMSLSVTGFGVLGSLGRSLFAPEDGAADALATAAAGCAGPADFEASCCCKLRLGPPIGDVLVSFCTDPACPFEARFAPRVALLLLLLPLEAFDEAADCDRPKAPPVLETIGAIRGDGANDEACAGCDEGEAVALCCCC